MYLLKVASSESPLLFNSKSFSASNSNEAHQCKTQCAPLIVLATFRFLLGPPSASAAQVYGFCTLSVAVPRTRLWKRSLYLRNRGHWSTAEDTHSKQDTKDATTDDASKNVTAEHYSGGSSTIKV